jgi:hypothetical protein
MGFFKTFPLLLFLILSSSGKEKGVFILYQGGKRVGEEKFEIEFKKDRIELESDILISLPNLSISMEVKEKRKLDLKPVKYELKAETPAGTQLLELKPTDSTHYELTAFARGSHQSRELEAKGALIVDNNVLSHYSLLSGLLRDLNEPTTRTAIVPQAMMTLPLKLKPGVKITLKSGDKTFEATKFEIYLGDIEINLYMVGDKVIGGKIPGQKAEFYRKDLYPKGLEEVKSEGRAPQSPPDGVIESEVNFKSYDGTVLYGTITLPGKRDGPVPMLLLIHGSGKVDRNENAEGFRSNIFRDLAWGLAKQGIGTLRYDKRGTGKSGGSFEKASLTDLVMDALSALRFLKKNYGESPHFLLGHSEGAIIAPMVALKESVDGLILLEAPATPLDQVILYQVKLTARLRGVEDSLLDEMIKENEKFFDFVKSSKGDWEDYPDSLVKDYPRNFSLRWWREHLHHNPIKTLAKIKVPVLIVQGDKDPQVPVDHAGILKRALEESGNLQVKLRVIEGMNHLLRRQEGPINPINQGLDRPLDERVLEEIEGWVFSIVNT